MTSHENNIETKSQTQLMFESVYLEVLDLQIVEGFFSAVERKFFLFSNNTFDVTKAKESVVTLQELKSGSEEDFFKAERVLQDLLQIWKKQLKERDLSIETQHIRRFCDEFKKPFDSKVFKALARFYRTQPHSLSAQSKYDFVVTRAFLKPTVNNTRELKCDRTEIVKQLTNLAQIWNVHSSTPFTISEDVITIIKNFDEFIFEAEFISSFEELVKSRLFENLRDFKSKIGVFFYHPSVTTSAIECNVFVGNIFAELLAQENEKLSRIVSSEFDFADVLHDTSPTATKTSSQILENIRTDNLTQALNPDNDATHIWEWLQTVCSQKPQNNEDSLIELEEITEIILPAKQRISHILAVVAHPTSDKTLLFEYLQKSTVLKTLEVGNFLSPDAPEAQKGIFRATLSTIIWAEEIRNHELMKRDHLSDETTNEISMILEELQTLHNQLKYKIEEMGLEVAHNLLYVSNHLLESRLKLERAIIRYSKQNMEGATVAEETPPTPSPIEIKPKSPAPTSGVSYWLVGLTILIAVLSLSVYYFVNLMDNGLKVVSDAEKIEIKQLPGKENFNTAQRVRNVLYVTAKDSWKNLSQEQQQEILKRLLNHPAKTPIISVILINSEGAEIANATAEQIETSAQLMSSN